MRYSVEFHTSDYEFSHGKTPRGFGSWAFFFERPTRNNNPEAFWVHQSTYADAKKKVREYIRIQNIIQKLQSPVIMVYVGS